MSKRTSKQHVRRDIETIIRHRRGKRRSTNERRKKRMISIAEKILNKYHVRPSAWTLDHMKWLWEELDNAYSEQTAYVYKTIAREIAEFYGQWSYIGGDLEFSAPEKTASRVAIENA